MFSTDSPESLRYISSMSRVPEIFESCSKSPTNFSSPTLIIPILEATSLANGSVWVQIKSVFPLFLSSRNVSRTVLLVFGSNPTSGSSIKIRSGLWRR